MLVSYLLLGGSVVTPKPSELIAVVDRDTPFSAGLKSVLGAAGFPVSLTSNPDAWLPDPGTTAVVVSLDDAETSQRVIGYAFQLGLRVIAVAERGNESELQSALEHGASAAVLRDADADIFVAALRAVAAGYYLAPMGLSWNRLPRNSSLAIEKLSRDENLLLDCVFDGATVRSIALQKGWSLRTTHRRLRLLYQHLGVSSRSELLCCQARVDNESSLERPVADSDSPLMPAGTNLKTTLTYLGR